MRLWGAAVGVALTAALSAQNPARTPTPAPRLSGGFGRPRATALPTPLQESGGQALSDVVSAAARGGHDPAAEKSILTIDNRSLVKNPEKGRVSSSRAAAGPARPATTPVSAAAKETAPAVTAGAPAANASATGGTEAEWKETAARARKRVADDKAKVAELAAASKKLENDFYAWDDGQYRDRVIKPSWDRARSDLETARQELAEAEKDLADLPERARKAGAPPGWIRE